MAGTIEDMDYSEKLVFLAQWFDHETSLQKNFYLQYYPFDNTIELYDKDKNCVYLRRASCEGIFLKDMFVGNTIRVYGRQLIINDYGNVQTKKLISKKNEKTLAVFKPTVIKDIGEIFSIITKNKFKFIQMKMCHLNRSEAIEFYESRKSDAFMPFLVDQIVSGPVIAADLIGEDAIARWKTLMGPKDPAVARKDAPNSLRAIYGHEIASNGFHGADTEADAKKESKFFFPKITDKHRAPACTAKVFNSTCCVVKPHAVEAGHLGDIITEITKNGFNITALQIFYLTNENADEFLEVYKGVVGDFNALLLGFIDGPCVAMEISGKNDCDVHGDFRKFAGPFDPDIARQIRPYTLRAKFGCDKYKNAVHCTDLPEDTILELEYFFKILQE